MANFAKFHGITLANNSYIENLVVESLASDPVATTAGRVWFNTTSKTWNASFLNDVGAVVVRKFNTNEDFVAFVSDLASTVATKGTNLVGYEGHNGTNNKFTVSASTLKSSLDSIINKIDSNTQSIDDIGSGNLVNMQNEIDATQTGAGLTAAGAYVVHGTANYISGATTLDAATTALDSALKTEADARTLADSTLTTNLATEVTNRTNADTALQNELDATQTGAGLTAAGAYVVHGTANYISTATTLDTADTLLDIALKAEETARSTADSSLATNLATEVTDRTNADTTLTTNLATEVTNRTNADTAIRTDFASTASTKGASLVGIEDAGDLITATTVEGALAELHGDLTSVSLQQVYDQSIAAGGEVSITLAADKILKFKDNNDSTYFSLDPDGTNPIKVSMTGPVNVSGSMNISGNLTVSGATTEVTSTINNADHWAIKPAGADSALVIEPGALFTGDTVVDIKSQNGGASVLVIDKTNATVAVTKLTNSISAVFNGTTTVNGTLAINEDVTVAAATVVDMGANKVTNIADGVAVTDAVNLGQLNTAVTNANTGLSDEITARTNADTALQNELDATQTGAGLTAAGAYVVHGTSNYISTATTLDSATTLLDSALKTEETARLAAELTLTTNLATEVTARTNADTALQNELDATQTGSGLTAAGAYVVHGAANYISTATTLDSATTLLDSALKTEADARALADSTLTTNLATEVTARTNADTAIQNELDATQTGAGLSSAGAYVVHGTSNYISTATTLDSATTLLDSALKTEETARLAAELTLTNNLATEVTNRTNADTTLTTNLAAEVTNRTNADTAIRTDINSQIYTYESSVTALQHVITHNLNTAYVNYTVWVKGGDNVYRNDIVAVTETSSNELTIDLTESRNIKIAVRKVASI